MVAPKTTSATSGTKVIRCRRRLRGSLCIIYPPHRGRAAGQFGGNLATASENFFNIGPSPGAPGKKPGNDTGNDTRNDRRDDRIDQRFRRKACAEALVWRFRSPHHSCRESEMRTSEPKPHKINK